MVTYKKLQYDNSKVQVESAIRDGNGVKIDTNYRKNPKVIEYTVPSTVSAFQRYVIATDDNYDGSPRYIKMRLECVSSSYTQNAVIEIGWAKNANSCSYANVLGMTAQGSDVNYIGINVPNDPSYNTTYPPQIHIYNTTTSEKHIKITILDSNCELTWKTAWDTVRSTTNMSTLESSLSNGQRSAVPYASLCGVANSSTYTNDAYFIKDIFRVSGSDSYKLMAIADDGVAYHMKDDTKKFTLPIKMYIGAGVSNMTFDGCRIFSRYNQGYTNLSHLSNSSYNDMTVPTWTASDGGKTLYVRGSLDNGKFVCDGNITLSMAPGYTYIPFGKIAPNYSGSTAQVPTQYTFNAINVSAYTIDSNGKLTHVDGQETGGGGSVQLLNQSVTFVSDNTYEEFPYRASVTVSGISSSTYAEVTYSEEQATSLNFATFCDTATNVIYLYSRTNVGTVTIPTISIGMDYSDITIDSTPTSGSGNAVSSGGVYTALAGKQNAITISDQAPSGGSNGDIWIQY